MVLGKQRGKSGLNLKGAESGDSESGIVNCARFHVLSDGCVPQVAFQIVYRVVLFSNDLGDFIYSFQGSSKFALVAATAPFSFNKNTVTEILTPPGGC